MANEISYSDGSVENRILSYLNDHGTVGLTEAIPDRAAFHNFSPARTSLVRWYPFTKEDAVLEIGAGMGALTEYLAKCCGHVTAIEGAPQRAEIIAARCGENSNVEIITEDFLSWESERKYDYVIAVGVLEWVGKFSKETNPWQRFLSAAKKFLKPDGKLLLAIENRFGMKYWCGAAEDHSGVPFDSINDYSLSNGMVEKGSDFKGVRTFDRNTLNEMLLKAGFQENKFFYPLPDYKFPTLILSDESQNIDELIADVKFSYSDEATLIAEQKELLIKAAQNGVFPFFANSFLVEACLESNSASDVQTVLAKRDCKEAYRIMTVFSNGKVIRKPMSDSAIMHFEELVENTEILSRRGIPCLPVTHDTWDNVSMDYCVLEKADHACQRFLYSEDDDALKAILDMLKQDLLKSSKTYTKDGVTYLCDAFVDLIPKNAFVDDGKLVYFDQEWRLPNVELNYVLYRGIVISIEGSEKWLRYFGITAEDCERYKTIEQEFLTSCMDAENCGHFDPMMYGEHLTLWTKFDRERQERQKYIETLVESERDLTGKLANSEIHVGQLMESERDLSGRLSNSENHVQQLMESERELTGKLTNSENHVQQLMESERELTGRLTNSEKNFQQLKLERESIDRELHFLQGSYAELEDQKENLQEEKQGLREENHNLQIELNNKLGHIELLLVSDRELERIHNSRSWKFMGFIWMIRDGILPKNSRRRFVLKIFFNFLRNPIAFVGKINSVRIKRVLDGLATGEVQDPMERMRRCFEGTKIHVEPIQLMEVPKEIEGNQWNIDEYPRFSVPTSTRPLVSIVIPVYNQFHYTYACLKSIAEHSGDIPYEILIANDCSTDLTSRLEEIVGGVKLITNKKNLRFLLNCNHAAKYAKGQYILFLNNDTQVQENWLRPLIDLIESDEKIGMVGSKLIYPDGHLQEAGGILWKDGSAWNFGHMQDPNLPEFNYVKEADYISGASIMIRSGLWKQLGGFDENFVPAYCEDSDLAFQVRKAGYKVMYQPKSVVVHFEGVSNGTDTASGQKAYQVVNSKKFYEKWKDILEQDHNPNAVDPFLARDRSLHKKTILMVDHYVPQFDRDAGSRTVFQYLKLFVSQGYNVKFIGDNFYQHEPYTTILQQMGIEVLYGPWYAQHWKEWIEANGADIQYAFLNRPHIAVNYIDWIREKTNARIVYYGHDLHFLRMTREAELTGNKSLLADAEDWKERELSLMRKADMAYYPSQVEVTEIHKIDPEIRVKAIPAYLFDHVENEAFVPVERKNIMFVGGYNHGPNVDAVCWFCKTIMPEVLKLVPDLKLHLIGSHAPKEVIQLANDHVVYDGMVSDEELDAFYHSCRVAVVPLRYGAGIKGKVVEAMQKGIPVMTTSVGAEGIEDAESILCVEDDPKSFAEKLAALYSSDKELIARSAASGKYINTHFSPANAVRVIGSDFDM